MQRFSLQDTFLIKKITKSELYRDTDIHNYFEIIFIAEGKGKHFINDFHVPYQKGDVFLIAPEDKSWYEIEVKTTFHYFQFTEALFSSKMNLPERSYWLEHIESILQHPNVLPTDIVSEPHEKKLIWNIHDAILNEYELRKEFFMHNISNMLSTIISIIVRNVTRPISSASGHSDTHTTIDHVVSYIRKNVYDRDRMRVSSLAERFHMSKSGLSMYFKRKTGTSIHHYILMYKLDIVKYRLLHTGFTVSEIAHQLGFTDESHLTRIFKKYTMSTPKQFKSANDKETLLS